MIHTFIDCPIVSKLWKKSENWLKRIIDPFLKFGEKKVFGLEISDSFINRAILATKQVIYKNRQMGGKVQLKRG